MSSADAFVAQEEDENQVYNTRVAGFDLLSVKISFVIWYYPYSTWNRF